MKITESKLRKMIRQVLKEFTPSAAATGARRRMKKGTSSPETKAARDTAGAADTAFKGAEKAVTTSKASVDSAEKSVSAAKDTLNTKDTDLKKHLEQEPTGDKKETTQYSWTNTATGKKTLSSNNPGTVGGWEVGGKTEFTYTNTVTGKKVTTTSDPGPMGEYTIPEVGGVAELKPTSTHFFSFGEIKSKATNVKGPKEMITQIQKDITQWEAFSKEQKFGTLPDGFKEVLTNMKAALKTMQGTPQENFEYYSPGSPKLFKATKSPQQGKGSAIKVGEGGKDEKKFGTGKQYESDVQDYEKRAGLGAKKVEFKKASVTKDVTAGTKKFGTSSQHKADSGANKTSFTPASVSTQKIKTKAWTDWNNTKTTKTSAKNTAQSAYNSAVSDLDSKKSDYESKVSDRETKGKERDKKRTLQKQKEKEDIKKQSTAKEPTADEPKGQPTGGGAGKSTGGKGKKGKGKGEKGGEEEEKTESLFRILGRDTLNEIKEIKKYNSYLKQPRNRRRK